MMDNKQQEIYLEQIIIGAITKFDKIDILDLKLLTRKFREKFKVYSYWDTKSINEFVTIKENGVLELKESKDKALKHLTQQVVEFLDTIDVEKFKEEKVKYFESEKKKLKSDAKILVLSGEEADYQILKKMGFLHIDYFKSYINADKYFEENYYELDKYHIIILGSNAVNCNYRIITPLEERIKFIDSYHDRAIATVLREENKVTATLCHNESWHKYSVSSNYYYDVVNAIVENTVVNDVLEGRRNTKEYEDIKEYVNPDKIDLPTKKSDLKVLCLVEKGEIESLEQINTNLGVNVTFVREDNMALSREVVCNLGDYDIIMASEKYSSAILSMNGEAAEQCKLTGRRGVLLGTYILDENNIRFNYITNGELENKESSFEYKVCKQDVCELYESLIKEIIVSYNECSPNKIEDIDFMSFADYQKEQIVHLEELEIINELFLKAKKYVKSRKKGLIKGKIEGLRIYQNENGLVVENVLQGRTLCSLVFAKYYDEDNIRIFSMQTVNKKGMLGHSEVVGVYTNEFLNLDNIPNRPTEKQWIAINSLTKKVNHILNPILDPISDELVFQRKLTKKED